MNIWRKVLKGLDGWTTWGGSDLASEVDAYLAGELLERIAAAGAGGQPPAWLWLNAVVHGNLARIERLATEVPDSGAPANSWRAVQGVLARELLALSERDPDLLATLQRVALVPLELVLSAEDTMTPGLVADIAVQELRLSMT